MKVIRVPFLVAGGFFGVGGQAVALDGFHRNAGNVLDGEMQHGMFRHGGVSVAHHPFLVELGRFLVGQFGGDIAEGIGKARCFGKGHRDGFGGQIFGR